MTSASSMHAMIRITPQQAGQVLISIPKTRLRRCAQVIAARVEGAANFDAGNGHAYFRQSPWVGSDVLMSLSNGLDPATRGLEQRPPSPIWRFVPDYLTRHDPDGAALVATRRTDARMAPPGRVSPTPRANACPPGRAMSAARFQRQNYPAQAHHFQIEENFHGQ